MNKPAINARLRCIRHVALDMDGTIYNGSTLFPFTVDFLNRLKKMGIGYSFLTNNPTKKPATYAAHLQSMGIPATFENIYTSTQATIDILHYSYPRVKRLFILGTADMISEFEAAGFVSTSDSADDRPDGVVVGFDPTLTYARLCRAAWWIAQRMPYLSTNPDKVCPTDQPTVLLDCGSICAALEKATGREPFLYGGKPAPRMLLNLLKRHNLRPNELAMVGDRLYTDIAAAVNAKAFGVLVLSGETKKTDLAGSIVKPDLVVNDIGKFGLMIEQARVNADTAL